MLRIKSKPVTANSRMLNQVIQLTPPGSAAIAVLRLIGPGVPEFLRSHFSRNAAPGRCVHGDLIDGTRVIDDPVVVLSPDGSCADLNLHGGPWVVRSAFELANRFGFTTIDNARLPLPEAASDQGTQIEREILSHLPMAATELAIGELLRQKEAWVAFALLPEAERQIEAERMQQDHGLWWLLHPPRIALVGTANVGKSTLANQLFGQQRSITADLPGTTRDWVGEIANLDGLAVMLIDTPGVRKTSDPIEHSAIARAAEEIKQADLVLLVLDASRPLEPEQGDLIKQFREALCIVNKCDLPAEWDWRSIERLNDRALFCNSHFVGSALRTDFLRHNKTVRSADPTRIAHGDFGIVATSGVGLDEVRKAIKRRFGVGDRGDGARWWTERQRGMLDGKNFPDVQRDPS